MDMRSLALDLPDEEYPGERAREAREVLGADPNDIDPLDESEEEGEDLIDDDKMLDDYKVISELDRYDSADLDLQEYDAMSIAQRRQVEMELSQRERRGRNRVLDAERDVGMHVRQPAALRSSTDDVDVEMSIGERPIQRRRLAEFANTGRIEEDLSEEVINLDDLVAPVHEWITQNAPRREIERRFKNFLLEFSDEHGNRYYVPRISAMCAENKESFLVSYPHLLYAYPTLAILLANNPKQVLEIFDEAAYSVVLAFFPDYGQVHDEVHVRITDLQITENLRDLRREDLNALIRVSGVVTRRTSVFPQLFSIKYNCAKCQFLYGPYLVKGGSENSTKPPTSCLNCEGNGPFNINSQQTLYRNYQRITIQESPGTVPPGRVPRTKEVILTNDLKDVAKPGELVDVTGVYLNSFDAFLNTKHGFPVFTTMIEANYLAKPREIEQENLTEEDLKAIQDLAKDPMVGKRIIKSIAPSIFGHEDIKTAFALAMFGGVQKTLDASLHRIRGDINVLVLGDPGTAKSQFLKYVEKTADRAVFTTGKGASAVGLTASVRRDPITREWTLEGGALVLADQGICLIDEFDKMNDQDRTSIHEAMEQQSISISKAGIVATLQARCSVLAAANPIKGRYDSSVSFAENVELTDPILSRFDVLCVVRDTVDPVIDHQLALHVCRSHSRSHPNFNDADDFEIEGLNASSRDLIPQSLLKKYIRYARMNVRPQLTGLDVDKIQNLYVELREQAMRTGGIPITVRHVESIVRLAEAHAKMHLRQVVNQDDVNMAIRVMLGSFIGAQKFQIMNMLRKKFQRYLNYKKDNTELLSYLLRQIVIEASHARALSKDMREESEGLDSNFEEGAEASNASKSRASSVSIDVNELLERARSYEIYDLSDFLSSESFRIAGFSYNPVERTIIRDD